MNAVAPLASFNNTVSTAYSNVPYTTTTGIPIERTSQQCSNQMTASLKLALQRHLRHRIGRF